MSKKYEKRMKEIVDLVDNIEIFVKIIYIVLLFLGTIVSAMVAGVATNNGDFVSAKICVATTVGFLALLFKSKLQL